MIRIGVDVGGTGIQIALFQRSCCHNNEKADDHIVGDANATELEWCWSRIWLRLCWRVW